MLKPFSTYKEDPNRASFTKIIFPKKADLTAREQRRG